MLLAGLIALMNLVVWAEWHQPSHPPDWQGKVAGVAWSAFQRDQSPLANRFPSTAEIRRDLEILAGFATRVRTYASAETEFVPREARRLGLAVTAGAWLDRRRENNARELAALIAQARAYDNVTRAIVGNEVLLRGDLSLEQLRAYLRQARAQLRIPVSTAEPWHIWLKHPELADEVDFITIHLLPYWEGIPRRQALARLLEHYDAVAERFPGKPVVIGEVGWPSRGDRFKFALPSPSGQARFIRAFLNEARERGLDYYLMEAFDQPWKEATEGRVGAYWGVFDAHRQAKFPLAGPVQADPDWWLRALLASALAFLPILLFVRRFAHFDVVGLLLFAVLVQTTVSLAIGLIAIPLELYLGPLDWAMLTLLGPAQLLMAAILLIMAFEFVEVLWNRGWRRRFDLAPLPPTSPSPFVSIHLPCHNEPPEMVIATLESLAALDYPAFEVIVVDNNTESEAIWRPVERRCQELGERFRFVHLAPWPGFKAGALNYALKITDPRAEWIAVVDSDYVVEPNWLSALAGHCRDPRVAVVQCPQAHRDFEHQPFRRLCNFEYEGFFRIGMHHRNERNALIQHGTMTLVRKRALEEVGGWAEWCICEDAELGLRLLERGYELRYVDRVLGRGLTPADFAAYKSQRFRWAYGAMQILRAHFPALVGSSRLGLGQRYHFLTGWFGWFADALHLVFTLLALLWSLGMLLEPGWFSVPLPAFLLPILLFALLKGVFGMVLYRVRVPSRWTDTLAAALASLALSHAIARGVWKGLLGGAHPFERTAKRRRLRRRAGAWTAVREEALMLLGLLVAALALGLRYGVELVELRLWIAILLAQALPYAAAVLTAGIAAWSARTRPSASTVTPARIPDSLSAGASAPTAAAATEPPVLPRR